MQAVKNCKVRVIVPVYNVEKYLFECLDSICNQTFKDILIICVNDGSTDNSLSILEQFREKDDRIIVISKNNAGQSAARNFGVEVSCDSDYTLFVDSDDYIEPNFIEKLYNNAVCTGADIVAGGVIYLEDGKFNNKNYINKVTFRLGKDYITSIADKYNFMSSVVVWNKLYKNDLINRAQLKFVEGCRFEDTYWTFLSSAFAAKISFEPSVNYIYRIIKTSTTADAYSSPKVFEIIKIMDCLGEELKNKIDSGMLDKEYQLVYEAYVVGLFYSWYKRVSKEYSKEFFEQMISRIKDLDIDNNRFVDKNTRRRFCKLINSGKPFWKRIFR